jgi:hypothetical protein
MMDDHKQIVGQIFNRIVHSLFDQPIMGNVPRSHFAERMVEIGLGAGFSLASADWAPWDIDHESGTRIEVKQSAATQTWSRGRPGSGRFDIALRTGYWTGGGSRWVELRARHANLYVFCWHPEVVLELVDQRNPYQWKFFIVPAADLPEQKSISRLHLEAKWPAVEFSQLREAVMSLIGPEGPRTADAADTTEGSTPS